MKETILACCLISLTGFCQTNEVVFKGTCVVKKEVSVSEYTFLCEVVYVTGTQLVERLHTETIPPAFRKATGTFQKGALHKERKITRMVKTPVPITKSKIVVVENLPYAFSQFYKQNRGFHTYWYGKTYVGSFVFGGKEVLFEGNIFPMIRYINETKGE